ncbi:MAG TPA: HD domain-containing protein [Pyrinomonadaceae bacterium]|nr:HD domain-containing protein [Pyrinomonadaceae bacterium]
MAFKRMDQLRADSEDVAVIGKALVERQAAMPGVIKSLLLQLEEQVDGFPVDQLVHALQTATRAEHGGANEEMIVAALCHDIGKAISDANHGAISAEILKPYVSPDTYEIVRTHQDFQGRYIYSFIGKNPDARLQYADQPWYDLACRFSDAWDQTSFDPDYRSLPLEHFEPMIDRVFARPREM